MNEDKKRGKFLAKLRKDKKLKQSDLAKMINYSDKSISKWERGICFPKDTDVLIKLADIFNVSLEELLDGEYSDIEGKYTPKSINKFLNFLIKYRLLFIIIFIILLVLLIFFYYFVINFKSLNDRKVYDKDNINEISNYEINFSNNLDEENNSDNDNSKIYITPDNKRKDESTINNILLNEGFTYEELDVCKTLNENTIIYFYFESDTFKVYDYSNDENLIVTGSLYYDNFIVEYFDGYEFKYNTFENIDFINCNIEICDDYLDYAMYINYIKKLILE